MAGPFRMGQRWISEGEPELGLGTVQKVGPRTVTLVFGASRETRDYALETAPLRRARFRTGDTVRDLDGERMLISKVEERDGLLRYGDGQRTLEEAALNHQLSFSAPQERLLAGQGDPAQAFNLRVSALEQQFRRRQAPTRGFLGGRIELLPHQLHIAAEVTGRLVPRVLLADEVGLGKTIEACLILHRLLVTGRARRVLVLLPDSLVHQWFLELFRRFNLWFHIFDEARCQGLEAAAPGANPFLDDQLVVCGLSLLSGSPQRLEQAVAAGWDMLVVDEAHHLAWAPEAPSAQYQVVERLSALVPGLLLLTATPEQLGLEGHFARLRLLDPVRFASLAAYAREAEQFQAVARLADKLLDGEVLAAAEAARLAELVQESQEAVQAGLAGPGPERQRWLEALLDQHGTGRVMFRNTRAGIQGFPRRVAHLVALSGAADPALSRALAREFAADHGADAAFRPDFSADPRIIWLADLLRQPAPDKVLLICRSRAKVEAIEKALRHEIKVKMAVFHEGLTLVKRDRSAAWFAEKQGARLLICSEIGSEGRNFQFAQDLVLFDLPLDPDLLEQRIGRLDRIGQSGEIKVHVPFAAGSAQEFLARWFHEGLNAFEVNLRGGRELLQAFQARLLAASAPDLEGLLAATRSAREELEARLEQGRDRLLELNSFRAETAAGLLRDLRELDVDRSLDQFMLAVFEHTFVSVEELAPRTFQLGSMGVLAEAFPGLPGEGLTVTCDRRRALAREDIQFLTWDHPLVSGALDLLLSSGQGNCSFSRWVDGKASGLYLEAVYLLECIAPPQVQVDRFLPPTPLRVAVDHRGQDLGGALARSLAASRLLPGDSHGLLARPGLRDQLLPRMLERTRELATAQVPGLLQRARAALAAQLDPELARLQALTRAGAVVGPGEIALLVAQRNDLERCLGEARLRLDALHLVHRTR